MVGWYNMKSKWNDDEEVEVRFVSIFLRRWLGSANETTKEGSGLGVYLICY